MEQRSSYAEAMDAQIGSSEEECALGTGRMRTDVAKRAAKLKRKESAIRMGHITMQMMNLLHLDQNMIRLLQLNLCPMSMLLDPSPWDK